MPSHTLPPAGLRAFRRHLLPAGNPWVNRFFLVLAIGLLIRLCIMPFFAHIDFFSEYRRIHGLHQEGGWYPGSRFVTTTVERIHYSIVHPLLPEADSMFNVPDLKQTTASHLEYFGFVSHQTTMRAVFLLKIPYLLFDLAGAFLLFAIFGPSREGLRAAAFWLFNPITLFAFYVFGRYESIVLAFLLLALLMIQKKKWILSAVALGFSVWSREIMVLLLPFFLIFYFSNREISWPRKIAITAVIGLFTAFAGNLLPNMLGLENTLGGADKSLAEFSQARQILGLQVVWYFPFITACVLLCYNLWNQKQTDFTQLLRTLGLFFSLLFVCTVHSVHYVSWSMGVFVILAAVDREISKAVGAFCLSWIAFWLVGTDLGVFTHWLASPSTLWWVNLPTFPYVIERFVLKGLAFDWNLTLGIMRSIYAAGLILCFWKILKSPSRLCDNSTS